MAKLGTVNIANKDIPRIKHFLADQHKGRKDKAIALNTDDEIISEFTTWVKNSIIDTLLQREREEKREAALAAVEDDPISLD